MTLRWIFATLHLLALGLGLGAVYARAKSLRGPLDDAGLSRVFLADAFWGLAGLLWLITGLARAFGGLEKGTAYYLSQGLFHAKLGLFVVVLVLEIWPMITLARWRYARRAGNLPDTSKARALAAISHAQAGIVVVIVFLATAIARGL
jgi:putative membrane protein